MEFILDLMVLVIGGLVGHIVATNQAQAHLKKWQELAKHLQLQQQEMLKDWKADHERKQKLLDDSNALLQKHSAMFLEISEAVADHVPNCPGCARMHEVFQRKRV